MKIKSPWIICRKPNQQAKLRLLCFPYVGGGASVFRTWPDQLAPVIEVYAIKLPGREDRLRETPFTQLPALVQTLVRVLQPYLDKPFAFFGHSMGALIAFELARQLRHHNGLRHLFVSARRAPQIPSTGPLLHLLPEAAFIEGVQQLYGGIPEVVLQDEELLASFLPLLRADMTLFETYTYVAGARPDCPISVFGGLNDRNTTQEGLAAWREQTRAAFSLRMFPGEHFFLNDAQGHLLQAIISDAFPKL